MNESNIPAARDPQRLSFRLEIDFPPDAEEPQRIFTAAARMIAALQECDSAVLQSCPDGVRSAFVLEQVASGSLRIVMKQIVAAVPDEVLMNLDLKHFLGSFLVRLKYFILSKLDGETRLPDEQTLRAMTGRIADIAAETGAITFPGYTPLNEVALARLIQKLGSAMSGLHKGESAAIRTDEGCARVGAGLVVTEEEIERLLVKTTSTSFRDTCLTVRRPDFLSNTQWEFRYGDARLSAAIDDRDWLHRYHSGQIPILPGDSLKVRLETRAAFDEAGGLVSEKSRIVKVLGVLHRRQLVLPGV